MDEADPLSRYLANELEGIKVVWGYLIEETPALPTWTWEDIQEGLLNLTDSPVEEMVIRGALSAVLKEARFKPPDQVLWEILRLAAATRDHGFRFSAREMLEAEMP